MTLMTHHSDESSHFPRTIEKEFVQRAFVRVFCTRPTKNGGSEMCDVLFWGAPGCVTKCDRGRGSKLAKNSVTYMYFMDSPMAKKLSLINSNGNGNAAEHKLLQ